MAILEETLFKNFVWRMCFWKEWMIYFFCRITFWRFGKEGHKILSQRIYVVWYLCMCSKNHMLLTNKHKLLLWLLSLLIFLCSMINRIPIHISHKFLKQKLWNNHFLHKHIYFYLFVYLLYWALKQKVYIELRDSHYFLDFFLLKDVINTFYKATSYKE